MPVGKLKNTLYGVLLPVAGKRCQWPSAQGGARSREMTRLLHKRRAVGACVQTFENGRLSDCYTAGYAALTPEKRAVTPDTVFRTASVAKMVTALLVFRLQTLGKLTVWENVSDFLGYPVVNPRYPDAPITLGMLLNHTSSLIDHPAYFASFAAPSGLRALLSAPAAYSASLPGLQFRYSNFAAGMIGCLLEKRFEQSFEALAQKELFAPLGVAATFDPATLAGQPLADSYRVLPAARCFSGAERQKAAQPLSGPDPESHYLLASGNLYLTAANLAKLALALWDGHDGFISPECLDLMRSPTVSWPQRDVALGHGMGLLKLEDKSVYPKPLWGHQGFAYGAVNGVFFDESGNGFASLNSGVSEQRTGHLAVINQDLIRLLLSDKER